MFIDDPALAVHYVSVGMERKNETERFSHPPSPPPPPPHPPPSFPSASVTLLPEGRLQSVETEASLQKVLGRFVPQAK